MAGEKRILSLFKGSSLTACQADQNRSRLSVILRTVVRDQA